MACPIIIGCFTAIQFLCCRALCEKALSRKPLGKWISADASDLHSPLTFAFRLWVEDAIDEFLMIDDDIHVIASPL